ncbi:MAG: hypothetical protein AB7F59_13090 [Bdellovibrionales bacterium]
MFKILLYLSVFALNFLIVDVGFAQAPRCNERMQEYNYQDRCEQVTRSACEYNRRTGCYVPLNNPPGRCERRYDEFNNERQCLQRFPRGCEYRNGCWVERSNPPPRPVCEPRRGEYNNRNQCERLNPQGCRQVGRCWIPLEDRDPVPTPSTVMRAGQSLKPNQSIASPNNRYRLFYQGDNNLVLYGPRNQPLWASNTAGRANPSSLEMQGDGNLVIYNTSGSPIWASNTSGNAGAYLGLHNNGLTAIYLRSGRILKVLFRGE